MSAIPGALKHLPRLPSGQTGERGSLVFDNKGRLIGWKDPRTGNTRQIPKDRLKPDPQPPTPLQPNKVDPTQQSVQRTAPGSISEAVERFERGEISAEELSARVQELGVPRDLTGVQTDPDLLSWQDTRYTYGDAGAPERPHDIPVREQLPTTTAGPAPAPTSPPPAPTPDPFSTLTQSEQRMSARTISGVIKSYEQGDISLEDAKYTLRGLGVGDELLQTTDIEPAKFPGLVQNLLPDYRFKPGPGASPLALLDPANYERMEETPEDTLGGHLSYLTGGAMEGADALAPLEMSIPYTAPIIEPLRGLSAAFRSAKGTGPAAQRVDDLIRGLGRTARDAALVPAAPLVGLPGDIGGTARRQAGEGPQTGGQMQSTFGGEAAPGEKLTPQGTMLDETDLRGGGVDPTLTEQELARQARRDELARGQQDMFGDGPPAPPPAPPPATPVTQKVTKPASKSVTQNIGKKTKKGLSPKTIEVQLADLKIDDTLFQTRERDPGKYFKQSLVDTYLSEGFDRTKLDRNPIVAWRNPKNKELVVLSGHHRYAMAEQSAQASAPVKVFKGTLKEAQAFAVLDNFDTAQMTLMGMVQSVSRLADLGFTPQQIATKMGGVTSKRVKELQVLAKLGPEMITDVQAKQALRINTEGVAVAIGRFMDAHPGKLTPTQAMENYTRFTSDPSYIPTESQVTSDLNLVLKADDLLGGQGDMFGSLKGGEGFQNPVADKLAEIRKMKAELEKGTGRLQRLHKSLTENPEYLDPEGPELSAAIRKLEGDINRNRKAIAGSEDEFMSIARERAGMPASQPPPPTPSGGPKPPVEELPTAVRETPPAAPVQPVKPPGPTTEELRQTVETAHPRGGPVPKGIQGQYVPKENDPRTFTGTQQGRLPEDIPPSPSVRKTYVPGKIEDTADNLVVASDPPTGGAGGADDTVLPAQPEEPLGIDPELERLVPMAKNWDILTQQLQQPDTLKKLATKRFLSPFFKILSPRIVAKDPVAIARTTFRASEDIGNNIAKVRKGWLNQDGDFQKLFGRVDLNSGRFTKGPFRGEDFLDVIEKRNTPKYKAILDKNPVMRQWLTRHDKLYEARFQLAKAIGKEGKKLTVPEGEFYTSHRWFAKTAHDGSILETAVLLDQGGAIPPSMTPGFLKHRVFRDRKQLQEFGFRSMLPDDIVYLQIQTLKRSEAEQNMYKWLVDENRIATRPAKEPTASVAQMRANMETDLDDILFGTAAPKKQTPIQLSGPKGEMVYGEESLAGVDFPSFRSSNRVLGTAEFQPGGLDARAIKKMLNDEYNMSEFTGIRTLTDVMSTARFTTLGMDFSPWFINLLMVTTSPKIWGKSVAKSFQAMLGNKHLARVWSRNLDVVNDMLESGVVPAIHAGTEMTEAFQAGSILQKRPFNIIAKLYEPFQRTFESALDVAAVEMWQAHTLGRTLTDVDKRNLASHINHMRGVLSASATGTTLKQRQIESMILLAPRYNRATAALLFDITRGGIRGELARKVIIKFLGGMAALNVGIGLARGESWEEAVQHMNPASPMFMTHEVGGQRFGVGGKVRSLIALMGRMYRNIGRTDEDDNPLEWAKQIAVDPAFTWVQGNYSPLLRIGGDLLEGENFEGDPTRDSLQSAAKNILAPNFMPFWIDSVFMDGGSVVQRAERGTFEAIGGRARKNSPYENWRSYAEGEYGKKDISRSEQLDLRQRDSTARTLYALYEDDREASGESDKAIALMRASSQMKKTDLETATQAVRDGTIDWPKFREIIQQTNAHNRARMELLEKDPDVEKILSRWRDRPSDIPADEAYRRYMQVSNDPEWDLGPEGFDYANRDAALRELQVELGEEMWQSVMKQRDLERQSYPFEVQLYYRDTEILRGYWELAEDDMPESQKRAIRQRARAQNPVFDAILVKWYGYQPMHPPQVLIEMYKQLGKARMTEPGVVE